jgi:hypothetical protein
MWSWVSKDIHLREDVGTLVDDLSTLTLPKL